MMSVRLEAEVEARLAQLDGQELKEGTFRAVERLLVSTSSQGPLVLVGEDLHWADPTSIELLERLLPLTERTALLIVCLFRPEREHRSWRLRETAARDHGQRHTGLWLDPLSAAESERLVGNLLWLEQLPEQLKERILGRTEGNPFYLEEVLRSLIDEGAIAQEEATGRWLATRDVAEIAIPETLHGVLLARIDRLQEETKRVLQMAAVIGRLFLYRVLAAVASEERDLDGRLLTLQREEMIRERARLPELEYIFKHHLTQEAAYNGLLKAQRRVFHRQVAEALERLFQTEWRSRWGCWPTTGSRLAMQRRLRSTCCKPETRRVWPMPTRRQWISTGAPWCFWRRQRHTTGRRGRR
jgi:predicted ATPase